MSGVATEPEVKRYATIEELEQLRANIIAIQSKDFKFPEIPSHLKLTGSQREKYLFMDDPYVRAYNEFYEKLNRLISPSDYFH